MLAKAGQIDRVSATRAASRRTCNRHEEALDFIMEAIETAGYKPGKDVMLALDCAATEFFTRATTT